MFTSNSNLISTLSKRISVSFCQSSPFSQGEVFRRMTILWNGLPASLNGERGLFAPKESCEKQYSVK
jgi:hypothetical protein